MSQQQVDEVYKVDDKQILGFFGEHRFLSNFHLCPLVYEDIEYPHSEAAFQAAKTHDLKVRETFKSVTPLEAQYMGRRLALRKDWEQVKLKVMRDVLRAKFKNPELRKLLLGTGNKHLEEANWWGDVYWGTVNGKGGNWLGKLLMEVRHEAKAWVN